MDSRYRDGHCFLAPSGHLGTDSIWVLVQGLGEWRRSEPIKASYFPESRWLAERCARDPINLCQWDAAGLSLRSPGKRLFFTLELNGHSHWMSLSSAHEKMKGFKEDLSEQGFFSPEKSSVVSQTAAGGRGSKRTIPREWGSCLSLAVVLQGAACPGSTVVPLTSVYLSKG